ncbi:TDP-N-acetylfucosamine:lipid II N-acetylfucosaminyltransferase [Citrobacter amalonaticus]|uniref:TDP-N-acetylfucosamine:lipid II N-acetylfucosaminyltransferase n=1 Tax=Citrobacter amalonaticus TaxID=35703 RepID=UPI00300CC0B5
MKYVHICPADKFIPGFIELMYQHFEFSEHQFWIYGDTHKYGIPAADNIFLISGSIADRLRLLVALMRCRKVIFHSFHGIRLALLLLLNPWSIRKSYWFIWGGDLYQSSANQRKIKWHITECLRKYVIRRMAGIVTYIRGDYLNACHWYRCEGKWYECLMYTSNVFTPQEKNIATCVKSETLTILVGNSALPTNNHLSALSILQKYADKNISIVCPLSYGIQEYGRQIQITGQRMFGKKFTAITRFMPVEDYLTLLRQIDIAVFNHTRQQAMGNTIALLGEGKTVFLNPGTTQWDFFCEKQIHVCDLQSFSLTLLPEQTVQANQEIIRRYFSRDNLINQLSLLFQAR